MVKFVQGNVVEIKDCFLLLPVVSTCWCFGFVRLFGFFFGGEVSNLQWTLKQIPKMALVNINYTFHPADVNTAQVENAINLKKH